MIVQSRKATSSFVSKSALSQRRWTGWLPVLCLGVAAVLGSTASVEATAAFPDATFELVGIMAQAEAPLAFAIAEAPVDGSSLVVGGSTLGGTWLRSVRRYSLVDGSWQVLENVLPYPWYNNERHGAALASNGLVYVGPGDGPGGWGQHDRIIELDVTAGTARERAPIVSAGARIWGVALAAAPASRGGVYLIGGWNGGGISDVRHYDPATDQTRWVGHLAVPRTVGVRVSHANGRVYLFGGNTFGTMSIVEVLDTNTETIRTIANPGGFQFIHGTLGWVGADGFIYLWNPIGSFMGASSDRIIRFDPATETFENLGDSPMPTAIPMSAFADLEGGRTLYFGFARPGYVWGASGTIVGEVWQLTPMTSNEDPVADAGVDQQLTADAACRTTAHLDGSASFDPDGDALAFRWTTPAGSFESAAVDVVLALGDHGMQLQVTDGKGGSDTDEVAVRVVDGTGPTVELIGPMLQQVECGQTYVEAGATARDNCDASPTLAATGTVSSSVPGNYEIRYVARDASANLSATAVRTVAVVDSVAPTTPAVSANPTLLWPPNHRMVAVSVVASSTDRCTPTPACAITAVTSSESVNGGGDGDTAPDWQVVSASQVLLRAERSGGGPGRVYSVTVACADASGNRSVGSATVRVPLNQSGR